MPYGLRIALASFFLLLPSLATAAPPAASAEQRPAPYASASGEPQVPASAVTVPFTAPVTPQSQENAAEEVRVLKSQLKVMEDFTEHILSTVYWALGAIVSVALLFLGYVSIKNEKTHTKEIQSIKDESASFITSKLAEMRNEIGAENRADISAAKTELSKVLAELVENTTKPMQRASKDLETKIERASKQLGERADRTKLAIDTLSEVCDARYWEFKNVPGNEFKRHITLLKIGHSSENNLLIDGAIKRMILLLPDLSFVHSGDLRALTELLTAIPSSHAIQVEALQAGLRTKNTL